MNPGAHPPNRIPWPPVILLASIGGGMVFGRFLPILAFEPGWISRTLGAATCLTGIGFDVAAVLAMRKARTNILPHRSADRLLTQGIFGWSRNPIYFGNVLVVLGLVGVTGNGWFALSGVACALATLHLAIRHEEAHLSARFPEAFTAYRLRTGRWLSRRRTG
ncbi:methyltransferase family protein [Aureimonas sp. N4]|uniref:methyltransferase family protein n=1 Tax=Aureimonas sp. N4 TaxID=1638165 RepID=UPI0007816754|nr:isoprenylcysteine carboxylmethyltransferase family protein [Aureimonas sp. N4]